MKFSKKYKVLGKIKETLSTNFLFFTHYFLPTNVQKVVR